MHDPRLTEGSKTKYEELLNEWMKQKNTLDKIINEDLKAYNDLYKQMNLPALILNDK